MEFYTIYYILYIIKYRQWLSKGQGYVRFFSEELFVCIYKFYLINLKFLNLLGHMLYVNIIHKYLIYYRFYNKCI